MTEPETVPWCNYHNDSVDEEDWENREALKKMFNCEIVRLPLVNKSGGVLTVPEKRSRCHTNPRDKP